MSHERPPLHLLAALGTLSLVAFGVWFYGYGVLLEPIRQDTGWPEALLTTTYGLSLLLTGVGAVAVGRAVDHGHARRVFAAAAVVASMTLALASFVASPLAFAALVTVAGGAIGAGGYYPATQAAITHAAPRSRTKAITGITLFGAFASPVFLPVIGWLVSTVGWRPTLRLLSGVVALSFAWAAIATPSGTGRDASRVPFVTALRHVWRQQDLRRFVLAGGAAGVATSLLFLYQVPVMVDAGLALTLASTLAGARGLVQLAGRLPLPPVVRRIGSDRSLRGSFVLVAISIVLLLGSGNLAVAFAFVAVAGVATGAMAALEGIYGGDLHTEQLGTLLGAFSLVRGLGAALGPALGGVAVGLLGSRVPALLVGAAAALAAAALIPPLRRVRSRESQRSVHLGS
ncbi:MAG: MFS transporter [Nitriliruptorales bacterium]|nr:MFS transporter [Nitriliruptorales bacterium]